MAGRRTFYASVSFEYDFEPVLTHRCEIVAGSASIAARRALDAARKAFPNSHPRSFVVVLETTDPKTWVGLQVAATQDEAKP